MSAPADPPRPPGPTPPPEYVADDPIAWQAAVQDRLDTVRNGLLVVALLATAAAGLAAYALFASEGNDEQVNGDRGASAERVRNLDQRVDELEGQIDGRATKKSVDALQADQKKLEERVAEASGDPEVTAEDVDELRQSMEDLSTSLSELEQRVEDLEEEQDQQASA